MFESSRLTPSSYPSTLEALAMHFFTNSSLPSLAAMNTSFDVACAVRKYAHEFSSNPNLNLEI